jgi:uncharacterized protein
MSDVKQYRGFSAEQPTIVRAAKGQTDQVVTTVRGYGAVFGVVSNSLSWGFVEVIEAGAFDDCLGDDVRCLVNHDSSQILGRTKSGTLRIGVDEKGLWYECDLGDTQAARDLAASLERGDIDQSSFQFTIAEGGAEWTEEEVDGGYKRYKRTIKKVKRLYDVAPVTFPAYEETEVYKRDMEEAKAYIARKNEVTDTSFVSVYKERHELRRKQVAN